jgi:hypothetical protein
MIDEIKFNNSNIDRIEQHRNFLFIYLYTYNSEFITNETVIQLHNPEKKKIEIK